MLLATVLAAAALGLAARTRPARGERELLRQPRLSLSLLECTQRANPRRRKTRCGHRRGDCWAMCPTPHTMRWFACAPSPAQPAARAQRSRSSPTCWPCWRTPALSLARLPLRAGVRGDVNKPGRAASKLAGGQRSKQSWPATGPLVGPPPRCLRALMPGGWPAARTGATPRPPPAGSATRWQAASEAASSWPHLPPPGVQAPCGRGCATSLPELQTAAASATRPAPVPRWPAARLEAAGTTQQLHSWLRRQRAGLAVASPWGGRAGNEARCWWGEGECGTGRCVWGAQRAAQ